MIYCSVLSQSEFSCLGQEYTYVLMRLGIRRHNVNPDITEVVDATGQPPVEKGLKLQPGYFVDRYAINFDASADIRS